MCHWGIVCLLICRSRVCGRRLCVMLDRNWGRLQKWWGWGCKGGCGYSGCRTSDFCRVGAVCHWGMVCLLICRSRVYGGRLCAMLDRNWGRLQKWWGWGCKGGCAYCGCRHRKCCSVEGVLWWSWGCWVLWLWLRNQVVGRLLSNVGNRRCLGCRVEWRAGLLHIRGSHGGCEKWRAG